MEAGKRKITDILSRASVLRVPYFQRSYVWGEDQWDRFLEDMTYVSRSNSNYFLGSIILKQLETTTDDLERDIRTVVDGQQRLTTLLLFFKVLFNKNGVPESFNNTFTTFRGNSILQHNFLDKPLFDKLLSDQEVHEDDQNKKLCLCFKYFQDHIGENELDHNTLLSNITFVGIDLQASEDEQQIFDTINSLGVSLTTAELLKNYLFNEDLESYNNYWRDVFEKDDETLEYWDKKVTSGRKERTNIDLFLQAFLSIKIQEEQYQVNSEDKERYFKVDTLFNSYKELSPVGCTILTHLG